MGLLDPTLLTNLNKLKGLLGETPLGKYVRGKDQGVSVNGLKQALLGMPVFDQGTGERDMAYAMDAMGPLMVGSVAAKIGGMPWNFSDTAKLPISKQRDAVRSAADELAERLKADGFEVTLEHSGSSAGPSSYVTPFDPTTGRYMVMPARFSGHSKGAYNSQSVFDLMDDGDIEKYLDIVKKMREKGPTEHWLKQQARKK